jgi:hypothetical protein
MIPIGSIALVPASLGIVDKILGAVLGDADILVVDTAPYVAREANSVLVDKDTVTAVEVDMPALQTGLSFARHNDFRIEGIQGLVVEYISRPDSVADTVPVALPALQTGLSFVRHNDFRIEGIQGPVVEYISRPGSVADTVPVALPKADLVEDRWMGAHRVLVDPTIGGVELAEERLD